MDASDNSSSAPSWRCRLAGHDVQKRAGGSRGPVLEAWLPTQQGHCTPESEYGNLEKSFADMDLEYVPSQANFVLVKVGDGDAVFQSMLKEQLHKL